MFTAGDYWGRRLATELEEDPIIVARARWAIGAHLLAAGHLDEALEALEAAAEGASGIDAGDESLLYDGYVQLARTVAGREGAERALNAITHALHGLGTDGAELSEQLDTARGVFMPATG